MKVCPVCGTEYGDDAAFCSRDRSPLRLTSSGPAHGLIGQVVGERYQVESRLGVGGMGEVYLATHVMMGRRCALKVMSPALSKDPDAVTRFNREATNASRITHPNVCAVYDFGLTPDGLVYLAMEYIDGRTLTSVADELGPMAVSIAASLVTQCAAGLAAAHELGIVHRDLKPDNIMVVSRREGATIKLVDFGIAKAVEGEASQRVTKTGFVVGTPEYMSPEQLSGDPIDGRSDQYALALVFYRLITGKLPFEGSSAQETLVRRLTDPPRPLAHAHPTARFPDGLQGVMDKALARQPEDRYSSVSAFVAAVNALSGADGSATRKIEAGRPGTAAEIPPTRAIPERTTRRRSRAGITAAAVVLIGVGTWGALQLTGTSAAPASPPVPVPPAADSLRGLAPTPGPAPTPAAAPAPPPPPAPPTTPGSGVRTQPVTTAPGAVRADTAATELAAAADTVLPELEYFDSTALRDRALRSAQRIMNAPKQARWKRARAAELLGMEAVRQGNKVEALRFYARANDLFPMPRFAIMIRQLRDSTPP